MTYTHYLPICRNEAGAITVDSTGWRKLGTHTSCADAGVTETWAVESVESTDVAGRGPHAEAIGLVAGELRCSATRFGPACAVPLPAILSFLGRI